MKEGPRTGVTHHLQSQPSPRKISSGSGEAAEQGEDDDVDFSEFLPDFQRVNISGEDNTGVRYARGRCSVITVIITAGTCGGPAVCLPPAGQGPQHQGEVPGDQPPGDPH